MNKIDELVSNLCSSTDYLPTSHTVIDNFEQIISEVDELQSDDIIDFDLQQIYHELIDPQGYSSDVLSSYGPISLSIKTDGVDVGCSFYMHFKYSSYCYIVTVYYSGALLFDIVKAFVTRISKSISYILKHSSTPLCKVHIIMKRVNQNDTNR